MVKKKTECPNPVDVHIGMRMRMYRTLHGLSQEKLAKKLDVTFQQVQKYEKGTSRISAGRLWEIAQVLGEPVEKFYEGFSGVPSKKQKAGKDALPLESFAEEFPDLGENPLAKRETLELVRSYYRIPNRVAAHKIVDLINALSKTDKETKKK